jgi:Bacterial Ig-like domain (group 3)/FG-GAP-like repeat
MVSSRLHRLLKKYRPLFRSALRHRLTLEVLEDRTVLSFLPPVTFPAGVHPREVTVADFNNDGKPDLAVVNQGPSSSSTSQISLSVLLGNGDGSFQPAVTTGIINGGPGNGNAQSVAVGDFNGDGLADVALNTAGSPANPAVEVLLGKGDGSFQPNHLILSVGQLPLSVAAGDFDRNGALDLVTANSNGTLSLLLGNGDGTFRPRTDLAVGGSPRTVSVGDFNGDGLLDVVTAQQLTDTVSVLQGRGDGTFTPPLVFTASGVGFTPESMAVGDVNGDGRADLVIKSVSVGESDAFQVGVLVSNGDGTFQAPLLGAAQPGGSGDLALGDFNGDGLIDAAVADELGSPSGNLSVFAGNGDGTFQSLIRLDLLTGDDGPEGVAAADLNGDGLVDLVAANFSDSDDTPGTVGVLLNNSKAVIAAKTSTTLSTSSATIVFGPRVTLTATVTSTAGVPTGTITFSDGTTVLGTARVNAAGQATLPVALSVGNHELIASFAGNGGFGDSTGSAEVTVNRAATTVALKSSVNPAVTSQAVTFTATLAIVAPGAGTPTGTVTFEDGNVVLGTVAVGRDGTATLTTSFAAAGSHAITAVYSGDSNFEASRQVLTEQVNATTHKTTTSLLASANPARVGQAVTFTAIVRDPSGTGTPTGAVTFFVGNTVVARVTLDANGQARIRDSFSAAGRITIRAVYSGDATFGASEQSLIEQVNAPTHRATTTSLLASANPARVGQAVTFTATVRDPSGTGTPTGTVRFFVSNTVVARVRLDANCQARDRGSFSVAGRFTIQAVHGGDATFDVSEQSLA